MRVAQGLEMLDLKNGYGGPDSLHPTLVWDNENFILIDAGLPGQFELLEAGIQQAGIDFQSLTDVIITHQDFDHIGSLPGVIKESKMPPKVLCHESEKPYLEGEKQPIKMTPERLAQIEEQMKSMPPELVHKMTKYGKIQAKVDITLNDYEEINKCGGITVIHTPGHTPGHICLYLNKYKTLISGDELNIVNGELAGPKPQFTFDMASAVESLKKLKDFDIEKIICYHGGLFENNPNEAILKLTKI